MIASFAHLSYARFSAALAPVALVSLGLTSLLLAGFFRLEPVAGVAPAGAAGPPLVHRAMLVKALIVTGALLIALLAGMTPSLAALGAASALLVTRRVKPIKVYAHVDWSLLAMFAGLFVVVAGVERSGLSGRWLDALGPSGQRSLPAFVGVAALLSNLVSNVPAVLLLRSWAAHFPDPERAWLALAMASTLAGNLTLVGSVANLIVVEQARSRMEQSGARGPGAVVSFWAYARVGIPLTLVTLAFGTVWLALTGPHR